MLMIPLYGLMIEEVKGTSLLGGDLIMLLCKPIHAYLEVSPIELHWVYF